jgi:hypothetical protein
VLRGVLNEAEAQEIFGDTGLNTGPFLIASLPVIRHPTALCSGLARCRRRGVEKAA